MRPQKETAIIINLFPYKETSKLVTFFSPNRGKFSGIVQGASRLKGRWGGKLDLFCHCVVSFTSRKDDGLVTVTDLLIEEYFYPIRTDLEKLRLASYFIEIIHKAGPADHKNLFVLFLRSLYYLKERDEFPLLKVYFELNLFFIMGIFPVGGGCINCGKKLSSSKLFFSAELGGELCRECAGPARKTSLYNRANWKKLKELGGVSVDELDKVPLTRSELAEVEAFCRRYREFHLGRDFRSLE